MAFDYLLAHEWYGADVALLASRSGSTTYQGQIVVGADGGVVRTLADLRGRTMCWSDAASPADSVLPRIMLRANGLDPDRDLARNVMLVSPRDVVLAVYDGTCDVGATYAGARRAVEAERSDVDQKVAVLATTAPVPREGVAFLPDLPADVCARIVSALLEIVQSEDGRAALQAICGVNGLEKADDSFYSAVRADLAEAGINMVDLESNVAHLRQVIASLGRAAVAFSGGVDSTLLLAICRDVLGREQVLALTVHSEFMPAAELAQVEALAGRLDVRHLVLSFELLGQPEIAANLPDRCYYCKRLLFGRLLEIAQAEDFYSLVHGANRDDVGDYRPGMRAAEELGVRAPLLEAGLGKADIRAISRELGLPTWNRPVMACLASRVPYGTALSAEVLARVDAAETWLRAHVALAQLRVRDHFPVARIEVPAEDIARLAQPGVREEIAARLRELGYRYVTLDLEGFRSGSLNEGLGFLPFIHG